MLKSLFVKWFNGYSAKGGVSLNQYCGPDSEVVTPPYYKLRKVVEIGPGCFCQFRPAQERLRRVVVSEGVKTIAERAFERCENLEEVILPEGLTTIDEFAFAVCRSLREVTLPDSLTALGNGAFSDCYSLTSVTIPAGVTNIEADVFAHCPRLTLRVHEGSCAHRYALDKGIRFELL